MRPKVKVQLTGPQVFWERCTTLGRYWGSTREVPGRYWGISDERSANQFLKVTLMGEERYTSSSTES